MNSEEYIEKWLNGSLTSEERRVFEQTTEYKSLMRLSDAVGLFKAPDYDARREYELLKERKLSGKEGKVVSIAPVRWVGIAAALLITLLVGVYFILLFDPSTTVRAIAAEKTKVSLPDSSTVTLNALSSMVYHEKSWKEHRKVILTGEAFFKVSKGSTFDVVTTAGVVTVLGTQFNVKARDDIFEVVCYSGLVQVETQAGVTQVQPGKMFRAINGVMEPEMSITEIAPAWLQEESSFVSVPFTIVLKEFERQYNLTISTRNVDVHQRFTGRFVHGNLDLALKSISVPLDLDYEIDEDKKIVVLSGEVK